MASQINRLLRLSRLPFDFSRDIDIIYHYATCQTNDFITLRALIGTASLSYSTEDILEPLGKLLGNETLTRNFIYSGNNKVYPIAEGPCGLRIPSLYAPFCSVNAASTTCPTNPSHTVTTTNVEMITVTVTETCGGTDVTGISKSVTTTSTSTEISFSIHVVTVSNTEIRTSLIETTVTSTTTVTTQPSAQTQQLASEGNDSYAATAVAATLGSIIIVMLVCIIGLLGYIIGTRK